MKTKWVDFKNKRRTICFSNCSREMSQRTAVWEKEIRLAPRHLAPPFAIKEATGYFPDIFVIGHFGPRQNNIGTFWFGTLLTEHFRCRTFLTFLLYFVLSNVLLFFLFLWMSNVEPNIFVIFCIVECPSFSLFCPCRMSNSLGDAHFC